ncbi:MAG: class I SAM-dependent methyltransferase [Phycisphaerae bacterium]|nr:class I SAM-dependent methyltransferase [Phycisphaerae bacterium]
MSPRILPTREGYDQWASVYDTDGNPLIALEEPRVAELLGEVRGLSICDVGCGTGRHAIALAGRGARVTAIDFSEGMLAQARSKPGAERVNFVHHDIAARLPLADASFERVICCLVVDHVRDLDHLFAEMTRVCVPGGRVIVSSMHPAMMLQGVQARFNDPVTGEKVYPESVPNQLSDYVMAAIRAGLEIDHLSEHMIDESIVRLSPRAAPYVGWPMLLMMRMRPGRG